MKRRTMQLADGVELTVDEAPHGLALTLDHPYHHSDVTTVLNFAEALSLATSLLEMAQEMHDGAGVREAMRDLGMD